MQMESGHPPHGAACSCEHHRAPSAVGAGSRFGAALLPALACAFCPACLTTYAKLFSVLGVSVGLDVAVHQRLMVAALGVSIGISAWRAYQRRRAWPLLVAVVGTALVSLGHALGELHALEWGGMLVLFGGAWAEHYRLSRRALAPA